MKRLWSLDRMDWESWKAEDLATLLFVVKDGHILLIEKMRGIGAGKINGPGGRLEPGETMEECAIREVQEEVCVTPTNVQHCGELSFQFTDGYSLHGSIFIAYGYEGEPRETPEAIPFWAPLEDIPYERMWADDIHWMPHVLAGSFVKGWFIFNGENNMLEHRVEVLQQ